MFLRSRTAPLRASAWRGVTMRASHIVGEPVEHLGRLADGEARRRDDRRQQALEALAAFRQLGGDDRRLVVHLAPHVRGHQADDAFRFDRLDALAGVAAAAASLVEPEPAVGIDHHLDDARVGERGGDGRTEGCAQHLPPAPLGLLNGERKQISHDRFPLARREPCGRAPAARRARPA